jgi:hypothetical protein
MPNLKDGPSSRDIDTPQGFSAHGQRPGSSNAGDLPGFRDHGDKSGFRDAEGPSGFSPKKSEGHTMCLRQLEASECRLVDGPGVQQFT